MYNKFRSLILFLVFALINGAVVADQTAAEDLYQIEIIFFEHTDPKRFSSEDWPKFVGKLDTKHAIILKSSELLPKVAIGDRVLNSEAGILKRSKDQRVIDQVAWRQTLNSNVRSIPVYVQSGRDEQEIEALISVKPVRGQFEFSVDSIYHDQSDAKDFRITRDVKLKKKEMFYLDHPILGMMLIVTPVATTD